MKQSPMFDNIEYTEDIEVMRKWIPLMMQGRVDDGKMAASKIDEGTDVNFGELTRKMARHLELDEHVEVKYSHQVLDLNVYQMVNGKLKSKILKLVAYLKKLLTMYSLVQVVRNSITTKTGIPESKHLGGFLLLVNS